MYVSRGAQRCLDLFRTVIRCADTSELLKTSRHLWTPGVSRGLERSPNTHIWTYYKGRVSLTGVEETRS